MSGIISSATVYKEYDYSNAIPTVNDVFQIVKLCDYWNQQLSMQVKEDEEKNAPFKLEFKDYMYKKVSTKKGTPFFIVNSSYPDDKYFYYYQTNNKENIEKIEKKIMDILSKGELPVDESDKSKTVPMSIEELSNNKNNAQNSTQGQGINPNFMKNFADILKKIQQKYPSLGKVLTTEKITKLFETLDDETKKKLIDLLPEKQKTTQGFYDNINSPQFKQGLGSLTVALESENLPAIISSFGLDINVAQKYGDGVEAFVRSIIAKYSPKEDKKEAKKEDKKEEQKEEKK